MGVTGDYLKAARNETGRTIDDLARETRIPANYLQALEDERFDDLPSPAHVKGFLASYCKALGVDPAPALEGVAQWLRTSTRKSPQKSFAPPMEMVVRSHGTGVNWTYVAIILVFVVGLLVAILSIGPKSSDTDLSRALDTPQVNQVFHSPSVND